MSAPLPFQGPLSKSRKADLEAIADALQVSKEGTKPILVTRIQDHFKGHPELAADPLFQNLFVYRSASSGSSGNAQGKKTSADKAAEDIVEENKKDIAATGYTQMLFFVPSAFTGMTEKQSE
jgi:hypothetical protein